LPNSAAPYLEIRGLAPPHPFAIGKLINISGITLYPISSHLGLLSRRGGGKDNNVFALPARSSPLTLYDIQTGRHKDALFVYGGEIIT